jgi:hypothetical protein
MNNINKNSQSLKLLLILFFLVASDCHAQPLKKTGSDIKNWPIITRDGDKLMEGGSVLN